MNKTLQETINVESQNFFNRDYRGEIFVLQGEVEEVLEYLHKNYACCIDTNINFARFICGGILFVR